MTSPIFNEYMGRYTGPKYVFGQVKTDDTWYNNIYLVVYELMEKTVFNRKPENKYSLVNCKGLKVVDLINFGDFEDRPDELVLSHRVIIVGDIVEKYVSVSKSYMRIYGDNIQIKDDTCRFFKSINDFSLSSISANSNISIDYEKKCIKKWNDRGQLTHVLRFKNGYLGGRQRINIDTDECIFNVAHFRANGKITYHKRVDGIKHSLFGLISKRKFTGEWHVEEKKKKEIYTVCAGKVILEKVIDI